MRRSFPIPIALFFVSLESTFFRKTFSIVGPVSKDGVEILAVSPDHVHLIDLTTGGEVALIISNFSDMRGFTHSVGVGGEFLANTLIFSINIDFSEDSVILGASRGAVIKLAMTLD